MKDSAVLPALFFSLVCTHLHFFFFFTSPPPAPPSYIKPMLLFSVPRLAVADLQIMLAQVATEAGAVLEIIDSVPRVELYSMCCRLGICGVMLGEFGICVVLVVEKGN